MYLKEIGTYDLLSKSEEVELAKKVETARLREITADLQNLLEENLLPKKYVKKWV